MLLPSIVKTSINRPSHSPPDSPSVIPNPEPLGFPLDRRGRFLLSVLSLGLIAGFCLAASLQPDPRGFGTHRQLGLPPCLVRLVFGIPCPSCGMTTSFACLMRGQFEDAFRANPAGLLLGLVCAAFVPWCWLSVFYARTCWIQNPIVAAIVVLGSISVVAVVQWFVRVFLFSSTGGF
ncbi:MAG TPA: DUF2752 domain-containing protein [Planctomycetaceae bacterium]|jgi:hypothetical protein|nr:DUF2752 domain-containing protein [Planctomycetaceae bacterium]